MAWNRSTWPYYDTPWDLIFDCEEIKTNWSNIRQTKCIFSSLLGACAAYILPIITAAGLICDALIIVTFFLNLKQMPRQMIYFTCMACSSATTNILFAWLWLIPSKGIPWATNGKYYFFPFYISPDFCRFHRFTYSLSSALTVNFLLSAALDRYLAIYFPMKLAHTPTRYAWYACAIVLGITVVMMLPFAILVDWFYLRGRIICWVDAKQTFLQTYYALFANMGLVQNFIIIAINSAFLIRIRNYFSRRSRKGMSAEDKKQIASCMVLLVCSASFVVASLPQSIAYMTAYIRAQLNEEGVSRQSIRLAYNVADLGWIISFLRETVDFFIYLNLIRPFRLAFLRLFPWCPKFIVCDKLNGNSNCDLTPSMAPTR